MNAFPSRCPVLALMTFAAGISCLSRACAAGVDLQPHAGHRDVLHDGQAGALYSRYPPLVNASRPPGRWQTYDIIFERARLAAQGNVTRPARLTVIHNGVVVQHAREFDSKVQAGDIALQDHNNPVRYRNLWLRPLNTDGKGNTAATGK